MVKFVNYKLSVVDAEEINRCRSDFNKERVRPGFYENTLGYQGHVGNSVSVGEVYPALVVKDFQGYKNLQVFLDGNDSYWATSRSEGLGEGQWTND